MEKHLVQEPQGLLDRQELVALVPLVLMVLQEQQDLLVLRVRQDLVALVPRVLMVLLELLGLMV